MIRILKYKFATNHGGFRFATSINGINTGEGGNMLIVDDPHNFMHINSIKQCNKVIEWFEQGFISCLNEKYRFYHTYDAKIL